MSTIERLTQRFVGGDYSSSHFRDNTRFDIPPQSLVDVLTFLKGDCGFDLLVDITAVDLLEYPDARNRFRVIYALANTATAERIYVRTHLDEPELTLASVVPMWLGADWMEREVFDMFGILFAGHPNLKRILMPEEFTAFPLRKDYPLRGRGERHNFPVITRAES